MTRRSLLSSHNCGSQLLAYALALSCGVSATACHHDSQESSDATASAEDASASFDASLDGGSLAMCTGDRNLGVTETYPDAYLIQNGGRVYNVKSPPSGQHAAVGDGIIDDTAALQDAWDYLKQAFLSHGSFRYAGGYVVYLPVGTYLVSDTIIYRGDSLEAPKGDVWDDVVSVRFAGESREGTIIKLADSASGFGDKTTPKIVLAYQHPDTRFNNIPGTNGLRNLTVDTGKGNPGAAGVFFQGANLTAMRNVLVRSGDGSGAYGFWFKIGSAQGNYHDLTVDGFDYGIFQNTAPDSTTSAGEIDTSFEHITLRNQAVAAVGASAGFLARSLCADETATAAQGLLVQADGTQAVLLDSEFAGATDASAIETAHTAEQSLFLRNVTTRGYSSAVVRAGVVALAASTTGEYSALDTITMFDGGVGHTLGLPIEDEPLFAWGNPMTDWADVDDYGAVGDGTTDDSAAVQRAMASGKPVVLFRKAAYTMKTAIDVPATVQRVDFLYSSVGSDSFNVSEASSTPLLIERGGVDSVTLSAVRPLVLHEMGGHFHNTATQPTQVYIENMANVGDSDEFLPAGSTMWARSLNNEDIPPAPADIIANGGTLWIFNYKTENKAVTSFLAKGGSTVEVFNGYVNSTIDAGATPMIVNDESKVSFIGFTNLGFFKWHTSLEEIRKSGTETIPQTALPARDKNDVFIPLYFGDAR